MFTFHKQLQEVGLTSVEPSTCWICLGDGASPVPGAVLTIYHVALLDLSVLSVMIILTYRMPSVNLLCRDKPRFLVVKWIYFTGLTNPNVVSVRLLIHF